MPKIRVYASSKLRKNRKLARKKNPELTADRLVVQPPIGEVLLPVRLHVERLPEGLYLATSDDVPGLVAQARTRAETIEIAHDVARQILAARRERSEDSSECTILVRM